MYCIDINLNEIFKSNTDNRDEYDEMSYVEYWVDKNACDPASCDFVICKQ